MSESGPAAEHPWGRVADDGTVYLRTADGERAIGSWQAGTAAEGLAYYTRKYDDLAAEVAVLEGRVALPTADAKAIRAAVTRLTETLPTASALGALDELSRRLDAVTAKLGERQAEQTAARAAAAAAAADRKRALVAEAEQLASSESWRPTGDRYRAIVEEWKTIRGVDRRTDTELWERLSAARREFDRRRRTHFAEMDRARTMAAERKQQLIAEAKKLADSTDWAPTARRFKELMTEWKAVGRAARDVDDALWAEFKAAQDAFFTARSESLSVRDAELRTNAEAKEALLAEAERIDPAADLDAARKRLRSIHDRWEKIGKVPRESMGVLEDRLAAVEQRVRDAAGGARHVIETESPLVVRLRESVAKLESRLQRAQAAGDKRLEDETAAALTTQREWLAQAERG
ncbi:MAG: hypothetical protein QOD07_1785 [Frankiaceae bacterium]|jgi:hypothetical protein|nr:hypothetical protein [Frankiaceae bacterium]